jgi:hypothetical protein
MTGQSHLVEATTRLREALEETAAALAAADRDRLLQGELALQLALESLTARRPPEDHQRHALRFEIERASRALLRCRHLGDVLLDVVRLTLETQGRTPAYGRRQTPVVAGGLPGVNTRG